MSEEERRRARKQFEENRAKARIAASRDQQKRWNQEEKTKANKCARQEEHRKAKSELVCERKASPVTTVQAPPSKRLKMVPNKCRLVWDELNIPEMSFEEIAMKEGTVKPQTNPKNFAHDAICDGLVIFGEGDGFYVDGVNPCKWYHSNPWRDLASKVDSVEPPGGRLFLQTDGGIGMRKIGAGTFNVVVTVKNDHLPSWVPDNSVLRITRQDREKGRDYKYQTIEMIRNEAENAMYASANGFGVRVHAIAPFYGVRLGRSMRYGAVYILERAERDLCRHLESLCTISQGMATARSVTEMLFKASRYGVAFHDIKPGNILTLSSSFDSFRLTDFDPAFFVVLPEADWRALLLLNLTLLSCHVRNSDLGPVSRGWATSVKPILMQLVNRKDEYDSKWLFEARSVNIPFDYSKNKSDFEMQRMMAIMATSYLYGNNVPDVTSKRWNWETKDQEALDSHWKIGCNRNSWPKDWTRNYRPLINQMVEFSVERAE